MSSIPLMVLHGAKRQAVFLGKFPHLLCMRSAVENSDRKVYPRSDDKHGLLKRYTNSRGERKKCMEARNRTWCQSDGMMSRFNDLHFHCGLCVSS
jgi:hypothetical protein